MDPYGLRKCAYPRTRCIVTRPSSVGAAAFACRAPAAAVLIVQDDVQQRAVDLQTVLVVDESQSAELVQEETYS